MSCIEDSSPINALAFSDQRSAAEERNSSDPHSSDVPLECDYPQKKTHSQCQVILPIIIPSRTLRTLSKRPSIEIAIAIEIKKINARTYVTTKYKIKSPTFIVLKFFTITTEILQKKQKLR